jgi:hypothetical protein
MDDLVCCEALKAGSQKEISNMGNDEDTRSRRDFIKQSATIGLSAVVGGVLVTEGSTPAHAVEMTFGSDTEGRCVTCDFWGGIRRISEDGKSVLVESLGYCSNPKSANYQKTTTPINGPMEAWRRWQALR